jgi:lysophospholipase L1-like esterase
MSAPAAPGARRGQGPAAHTYYLALGDDLTAGAQPNGDHAHGYASLLYTQLLKTQPALLLVNMGRAGETAASMWGTGSGACQATPSSAATQLTRAAAFLRSHRGAVTLVTLSVGANDLLPLRGAGMFDFVRVAQAVIHVADVLEHIYRCLRAAGPGVRIITMTYYNPLAAGGGSSMDRKGIPTLNTGIKRRAARANLRVALVDETFASQGGMSAAICHLTWYCSAAFHGSTQPTTAGALLIARTLLRAGAGATTGSP